MKPCLRPWLPLSMLLLLAGCESGSSRKQPAASRAAAGSAAAGSDQQPGSARRPDPAAGPGAAFTGYHRYRGTVGNAPVTLELTFAPDMPNGEAHYLGRYHYDRHGAELQLTSKKPFRATEPLYLSEADSAATGHWQATQPPGPELSGTWFGAQGRRLPFQLREDYAGAVRYEILTETADGGECTAQEPARPRQVMRDFLHLLGPDTLQPGLRRLQCPGPAQRRAQVQAELAETSCEEETYGYYSDIQVRYNGHGLLTLITTEQEDLGGAYPSGPSRVQTFSLSTGLPCAVGQWLRPEKELLLRQLLSRQLARHEFPQNLTAPAAPDYAAGLPAFGLNSEGLFCTLGDFGAPHAAQLQEVTIPYAALYPCVRPGTPLMRLIEARGLRPKS